MTTIATDGKSMAGESMTSSNGYMLAWTQKVHQVSDGRIFGASGLATQTNKFRRYMIEGGEKPSLGDEFCALVLNPDGTVDFIDKDWELVRYALPAAIGSGCELAQGAMLAGASPADAVAIACIIDKKSGGDITVEHITPALKEVA